MSKLNIFQEKAETFDKVGIHRAEVNKAIGSLNDLRLKYPFDENLREIEWLDQDRLYKVSPDETGEFFQLLEGYLKPLGFLTLNNSNVYRNARLQIKDFKNLLRIAVDDRKSLSEKIDAPWERIGGLGQDKLLAKQIIFCYNYGQGTVLPVFNNQHLRHFVNRVSDSYFGQTKYFSLGQEYEHYTKKLIATKNNLAVTKVWDATYFARFLYQTYPPPDSEQATIDASGNRKVGRVISDEQLELQGFMKLLGDLQAQKKISGEQFRENRELWMRQPTERVGLMQRLKRLLNS